MIKPGQAGAVLNRAIINNIRGDSLRVMNVTLMMLILAFFIVLTSLSVPAEDRRKAALGSLAGTLGLMPGGGSAMQSDSKSLQLRAGYMYSEDMMKTIMVSKFEEYLLERKTDEAVRTLAKAGALELSIETRLLFEPGSAKIRKSAAEFMERLGEMLVNIPGHFVVEGHTSSVKINSARYPNNIAFSIARAGAILRYLVEKAEVKKERISLSGYGSLKPRVKGKTNKAATMNNYIKIVYRRH